MIRFLGQRLFEALVVLFLMSFAIYGLIGLMPGDPIDLMINADPKLTPSDAARLKALYGLDRPIVERYWNWLVAALGGDLGYSRVYTKPVMVCMNKAAHVILISNLQVMRTAWVFTNHKADFGRIKLGAHSLSVNGPFPTGRSISPKTWRGSQVRCSGAV